MKFKDIVFALRGHDIGANFEEMLINAEKSGVKKLQLAMTKTINDVDFDVLGYDADFSLKVKNALDAHSLSVAVLGCYINPVDKDEKFREVQLTRFENFIRYAKDLNAAVIGTETGSVGSLEETHSESNYKSFIASVRRLVKQAEKYDVTVGIEPVASLTIHSPQVMRRVLDDVASDNLGVILDISNMITTENFNLQSKIIDDSFDLLGNKIKAVHLKDFSIENGRKSFAVPGEGLLEIKHIFDRIEELSISPEIVLDECPVSRYNDALNNLKDIIK